MSGPQAERDVRWATAEASLPSDAATTPSDPPRMVRMTGADLEGLMSSSNVRFGNSNTTSLPGGLGGLDGAITGSAARELPFSAHSAPYYEDEIHRLRAENEHLGQYASRLQGELERWVRSNQDREHRGLTGNDDEGEQLAESDGAGERSLGDVGDEGSLAPWIASPSVFSPLVLAYEARIAELRAAANAAERQLVEDREHIARLTQENDRLQADLDGELQAKIAEMEKNADAGSPTTQGSGSAQVGVVTNETIHMLNEMVDTLQRENGILQERDTILQRDVERLAEQGKERDEQLLKITDNFQSAASGLRAAKNHIEELRRERDAALHQLNNASSQLNGMHVELDRMSSDLGAKSRQAAGLVTLVSTLRGDLEDLAARANAESDAQEQRVAMANKRCRQVQIDLDNTTQDLESVKGAFRELTIKYEASKQNQDNATAALQALKAEVHALKSREEAVKTAETELRQTLERKSLERNQAMAVATQRSEEITRLNEARVQDGKTRVKEHEAAVKQAQAQMRSLLATRTTELHESESKCAQLVVELERAKRDHLDTLSRLAVLRKSSAEEVDRLQTTVSKLSERFEQAEFKAIEREAEAQQASQQCSVRISESEQERAAILEDAQAVRQQLQSANVQVESLQLEVKRLSEEADNANKDAVRMRQELSNARISMDSRMEALQQREQLAEQKATQRVSQAETKVAELELELESARQLAEQQKEFHTEEMSSNVSHFQRLVAEQKEECARLRARGDDLAAQILNLQHERTELSALLRSHENKSRKLDAELHASDKKAKSAKAQVAQLISSQNESVKELAEIRRKLDQAQVEIGRAERERDAAIAALEDRPNFASSYTSISARPHRRPLTPTSPHSRANRIRLEAQRAYAM